MSTAFYDQLHATGIVPVVVLDRVEDAVPLARALEAGGLPVAEVTFRTAAAPEAIAAIAKEAPHVLVGAGTVLNRKQAEAARDAGAKFIVGPGYDPDVVAFGAEAGLPVLPGCVTPTELTAAINAGLHVTKFFPANLFGGLEAINNLAAVFVGHKFMPTGGVNPHNVAEFLASPHILAVGGTWMVKPALFADGNFDKVEALVAEAAAVVAQARA